MSRTIEDPKIDKRSPRRIGLLVIGLVVVIGIAIWALSSGLLGGTNAAGPGANPGGEENTAVSVAEAKDQGPVEPITTFEGAMSPDWPKNPEDSVGCGYVSERLHQISVEVQADGLPAMRSWLEAMDDLQGDPSVADVSANFDTVKRTWSTVLAAEEDPDRNSAEQMKAAQGALDELIGAIDCN